MTSGYKRLKSEPLFYTLTKGGKIKIKTLAQQENPRKFFEVHYEL